MFEKDAEYYAFDEVNHKQEWYIKHPERSIDEDYEDIKKHWGKGAEFGYNKANEWHYVKDGDLPKKTEVYLVYRISGYGSKSIELIQYNSSRHFWCVDCQNEVIAWKEVILPKESE